MPQWISTPQKKKKFLELLALTGNITFSARNSGLSRSKIYTLLKTDPEFAAAHAEAMEEAIDRLEQEAWHRAVDGEEEYVVSGGRIVLGPDDAPLKKRRKSDKVLLALLHAHHDKYRPRHKLEISGAVDTGRAKERLKQITGIGRQETDHEK